MAKQFYTLKKIEVDVPSLRHLIEILQLPKHQADHQETESNSSKATTRASSPPSSVKLGLEDVEKMYHIDDSEEELADGSDGQMLEIAVQFPCWECEQRRKKVKALGIIVIDDEEEVQKKDGECSIPIPSAKAGQQRHDTMAASTTSLVTCIWRTYNEKTAPRASEMLEAQAHPLGRWLLHRRRH